MTDCDQHRTIILMSHLTKDLLRILMKRMRNKIFPVISKTQFGFMTDKGTRNAIFALKTLMERSIEVQKDLYLCFIDYSKALTKYDTLICLIFWQAYTSTGKIFESSETYIGNKRQPLEWTMTSVNANHYAGV